MAWVCSFGVVNCRICRRPMTAEEILEAEAARTAAVTETVSKALVAGTVRLQVSARGGIEFSGLGAGLRDGLSDEVIYRNILVNGSASAKAAIARAEQMSGRRVDPKIVGHVLAGGPAALRQTNS